MDTEYNPINCDYYDYLEAFAVQREKVTVRYWQNGKEKIMMGYIEDIQTMETKEEFLYLSGGTVIRLDQLISINDILNPGYC